MKRIIFLFLSILFISNLQAQIIGGSGRCLTSSSPNSLTSLYFVNNCNCTEVYDTVANKHYYFDASKSVGSKWIESVRRGEDWSLLGNSGTSPSTNFLGTTDAQPLIFRTNNTETARILSNGNIGIGIAVPTSKLHVNGSATVNGNLNLTTDSSQIIGGFGADALTGVLDWNDISNAKSGNGYTLLSGSDANGTGLEAAVYYHPFSFEYNTKNGTGNLTQLAVPYKGENTAGKLHYRSRVGGVWTPWQRVVTKAQGDIDYARLAGNNSWTGTNTFFNEFVLRDNSKAGTDPAYIKIITFKDNANAEVGWQGYGSNTNNNYYFYNNQGGFTFYTNGAERLNILNNGNVGIGIAVPTSKLHVAGSVTIADGTQGTGKVFVSDANGLGSWQTTNSLYYAKQYLKTNIGAATVDVSTGCEETGQGYANLVSSDFSSIATTGRKIDVFINGVKHYYKATPTSTSGLTYSVSGTTITAKNGTTDVTIGTIEIKIN